MVNQGNFADDKCWQGPGDEENPVRYKMEDAVPGGFQQAIRLCLKKKVKRPTRPHLKPCMPAACGQQPLQTGPFWCSMWSCRKAVLRMPWVGWDALGCTGKNGEGGTCVFSLPPGAWQGLAEHGGAHKAVAGSCFWGRHWGIAYTLPTACWEELIPAALSVISGVSQLVIQLATDPRLGAALDVYPG